MLHASTFTLTARAGVLEIRMGQTDKQTHRTTTVTLLRMLRKCRGLMTSDANLHNEHLDPPLSKSQQTAVSEA